MSHLNTSSNEGSSVGSKFIGKPQVVSESQCVCIAPQLLKGGVSIKPCIPAKETYLCVLVMGPRKG